MKKTFTYLTIAAYILSFSLLYLSFTDSETIKDAYYMTLIFALVFQLAGAYCWWFRNNHAHKYDDYGS